MRVLVVDGLGADRDAAQRYLQGAGHEVTLATDAKSGLVAIERQAPDVLVLDSQLTGMSACQFIQRLRQKETVRSYIVLVSAKPSVTELTAAVGVGADDYMRKPIQREELVIRVGALERIRAWAVQVFGGESGTAIDLTAATQLPRLQAWQQVDRCVMRDIAGLVGRSMAPTGSADALQFSALGAQIPLTLAAEQTEVRLTVGVDAATLPRLGDLVLGDPEAPEEALRDLLREFANTAGGAFMRAASAEGVSLTTGLPTDLSAAAFTVSKATSRQQFILSTRDGTCRIVFELEVLSKALRRVNVGQLKEGMVIARDLHTDSGALLVPGGTRLTSSQIERMVRILSVRVTFDVADAA